MVNEQNMELIVRHLGFLQYDTVPTFNHGGEIWCLWNPINIEVNVISKENRAIHYHVIEKVNNKQFILLAIYAHAQEKNKDSFCQHLKQLNNSINLPWCIMDDFNEMLCSSDKVEGVPLTIFRTRRLNDFLNHTRSSDANVQGRVFTWKKILRGQLVCENLDRVIFREACA